jgi:endonuclease/exonuclease/phosphatase family metal-dependent hydrolase
MLNDVALARLSVLTFNTWNCQGDYRTRLDVMANGLSASAPDIVLLQEVFSNRDSSDNTARHLANRLNLGYAYHPARTKTRKLEGEPILCSSGLAVLSRHPIVWSERVVLPSDPRDGERIAQFCEIRLDRLRLLVVNLHLSHLEFADNLRRQQLTSVLERIAQGWDHEHILIGGDFNAPLDAALFETFSEYPELAAIRAVARSQIGQGIDHLFALRRCDAPPLLISAATAMLDEADPESGIQASDHIAVQAWITLGAPVS